KPGPIMPWKTSGPTRLGWTGNACRNAEGSMNLLRLLQQRFRQALSGLVADPEPYVAMVKPVQDARFGDYQANCAMALAKPLGRKPRDVAEELARRLPLDDMLEPPEIAGPGFINLRLR